jgi:hypothetical protein
MGGLGVKTTRTDAPKPAKIRTMRLQSADGRLKVRRGPVQYRHHLESFAAPIGPSGTKGISGERAIARDPAQALRPAAEQWPF